jgi:hypothetical protein
MNLQKEFLEDGLQDIEINGLFGFGLRDKGKLKESIDFLFDNGFEPFKLNKRKLYDDLDSLQNKVNENYSDIKYFTNGSITKLKLLLENEQLKRLWKEVDNYDGENNVKKR